MELLSEGIGVYVEHVIVVEGTIGEVFSRFLF